MSPHCSLTPTLMRYLSQEREGGREEEREGGGNIWLITENARPVLSAWNVQLCMVIHRHIHDVCVLFVIQCTFTLKRSFCDGDCL